MSKSSFSWVDFAEDDRQIMRDLIGLFRDSDTRDELGIGSIRDAFANKFFPGTTTIQTRARYFLFIPWIYIKHEKKETRSERISSQARKDEFALIEALLTSVDHEGIIGRDARDELKRLASEVYWGGLQSWGIRLFPGSRTDYHKWLDNYYRKKRNLRKDDDGQALTTAFQNNWHPGIPDPPQDILERTDLNLTLEEAEYLQERIVTEHEDSLLAFLVRQNNLPELSDFVWQLPAIQNIDDQNRIWLLHAENFSDVIYGAAILYNLMLARLQNNEELIEEHAKKFETWAEDTQMHQRINEWPVDEMWDLFMGNEIVIPSSTKRFIEDWIKLCVGNELRSLSESKRAKKLVQNREFFTKGKRARLQYAQARQLWTGHAGDFRLDYRWKNPVRTIVSDILKPLV